MQQTSLTDINERPSAIVCIAYHQMSIMTGAEDLSVPLKMDENQMSRNGNGTMICTRRLLRLPIFVSVTSTFSDSYTALKNSNESVTTILNTVENQLNTGMEYVAPVTEKVGAALETPLKGVDNVICVGLNFLQRNVPSIELPPQKMYENLKDSFRSMIENLSDLQANVQKGIHQFLGENFPKPSSVLPLISAPDSQSGPSENNAKS